ncbi:protein phosphatase 1 regulatory subunit 12A-like isoform X14 [Xyrauchen texanus]|uniref:protein phosphatase 1 regulatory subunit 12A-like isoform X14 n=1 Tax=Xyrauchen texanus TaxID=154827 RepID=UPI00224207A2|nr:protein phosphatase 1 regulatory subunit 12A-like isoform X14 [Xyrauchen texanus]
MKMADAKQKRNEQLKRWIGSETDLEPTVLKKNKTKVKFDDGAVFLAACSSGDTEEVLRMLDRGADINYANVDGLTALHQACIDDNVDMVTFLVEHGACINQPDNEGWIPLHAAASCGYIDIAEYLISQGANVSVVNSEGETPLDIAEEGAMEELLQNEINRQGIDIEAARKEEERIMLRDARQWLNSGQINDVRHTKSGGTALHVAAAKGYTEVLKLLIQAGYDVNIKDFDGWSPLHAASHWGKEEACRILVENLCDMDVLNKVGQTAFDVADEDILGYLEELQKKQNLLQSEKKDVKNSPLIETTTTGDNNQSVKSLKSSKETLLEPEKTAPPIEALEPEKVDEEEGEGKKDESSCSSEEEEEEDSESENEADKTKSSVPTSNSNSAPTPASVTVMSPTTPTNQVTTPTSPTKKSDNFSDLVPGGEPGFPALWRQGLRKTGISLVPKKVMVSIPADKMSPKEEDRKDESPASWRLGLRKTGSYGALAEISTTKESQKVKDTAGVMRSASSPRLSSSLDNKDKEKKEEKTRLVAPIPRRHVSTSDIDDKENGSYTRRRYEDDLKNSDGTGLLNRTSSYQRSSSYGRRHDDALSSTSSTTTTTSTSSVTSPTGHRSLLSRYWAEESADKEKEKESATILPTINTAATTTTTSTTGTVLGSDGRERRRSYLTPVRDEESESQRKARSKQARQSRRSTQGVTLTDLQEAKKTISHPRPTRPREDEKEEKEKQDKEKQEEKKETETKEDDYRSRYRSFEEKYRSTSSLTSTTTASSTLPSSSTSSTSSLYSTSSVNRPNSLTGLTSTYSLSTRDIERGSDKIEKDEDKDGEDKSQPRSIRDRRRPREKRRSTGVSFWTQDSDENDPDQPSDSEDGSTKGESQSDRLSRNDPVSTSTYDRYESRRPYLRLDRDDTTDYKKLYEQILAENEKLKAQLRDTELELSDLKLQLEKATQRQERFADRSQLEMEKRVKERRALERKISEMEEELKNLPQVKQIQSLRQYNERLQAENRALARVLSKLSQGCSHLPAADL